VRAGTRGDVLPLARAPARRGPARPRIRTIRDSGRDSSAIPALATFMQANR